jgi:DNA-directed RNA polymerase I, II, and III subunit RPABC1
MDIDIVNTNIEEMLSCRGDDMSIFKEHLLSMNKEDFETDKNVIDIQTSNTSVIYALTKKLRKTIIDELKENIKDNESISTAVKALLNKYDKLFQKNGGQLQYFTLRQLMFNPTKHEYVPIHTKLAEEEVKEFMKEYMTRTKIHMHVILQSDPIAKWIGLKHGDIVRINRYNENSGESFSYRSCI